MQEALLFYAWKPPGWKLEFKKIVPPLLVMMIELCSKMSCVKRGYKDPKETFGFANYYLESNSSRFDTYRMSSHPNTPSDEDEHSCHRSS